MKFYQLDEKSKIPMYRQLFDAIKSDILKGTIKGGEKLPSKRALAKNLGVSIVTIETAYSDLAAEGYIFSRPQSGFFAENLPASESLNPAAAPLTQADRPVEQDRNPTKLSNDIVDFVTNSIGGDKFPFSVWTRLAKETMAQNPDKLMMPPPAQGAMELRKAIAKHLLEFRAMQVSPEQIIVGAGTEYLYSLLIQFFGYHRIYGLENPGYTKLSRILQSHQVRQELINLDQKGCDTEALEKSEVEIMHVTPSRHFPTGIVSPISRRMELIAWAHKKPDRFLIEDDFDSDFKSAGMTATLQSLDNCRKVIYMNTFSKSLCSTIRISYMILPADLARDFSERLGFYSSTVPAFEQFTLARFISEGFFERHINRMRTAYRKCQSRLIKAIEQCPQSHKAAVLNPDGGLFLLVKLETEKSDSQMKESALQKGFRVNFLSDYSIKSRDESTKTLVINYSSMNPKMIESVGSLISACLA